MTLKESVKQANELSEVFVLIISLFVLDDEHGGEEEARVYKANLLLRLQRP